MALREKKKVKTRLALFEAALSLASVHGFGSTTVDQIADRAGVSRRTFFRYFPNKEAAFFPHQDERIARFQHFLDTETEASPFVRVKLAFLALAAEFMAAREEIVMQQEAIASSTALLGYEMKLDKEWESIVAETLHKGNADTTRFEAEVKAGAIIGVIRATLRGWYKGKGEQDLRKQGERVFALLAKGFLHTNGNFSQ